MKIGLELMRGPYADGGVEVAHILEGLTEELAQLMKDSDVVSIDIINFQNKAETGTGTKGKVLPHPHKPGEIEVVICFMEGGSVITHVVGDGQEHVYPKGVERAIAIKFATKSHKVAFGIAPEHPEE